MQTQTVVQTPEASNANVPAGALLAIDAMNVLNEAARADPGYVLRREDPADAVFARVQAQLAGRRAVFVLDGQAPQAKQPVIVARRTERAHATIEVQTALQRLEEARDRAQRLRLAPHARAKLLEPHVQAARRAAQASVYVDRAMAKRILERLEEAGHVVVRARAEAEAQAAAWTRTGHAWAVVTRDFDAFLYGATRVARSLALDRIETLEEAVANFGAATLRELVGAAVVAGASDYAPPLDQPCSIRQAVRWIRQAGGFGCLVEREAPGMAAEQWYRARRIYLRPDVDAAPPPRPA